MPSPLTDPGVYIAEIPSGVRTIPGVATSITAFLGRAIKGDVNEPVTINSYADFDRQFCGLGVNYPMSYAVRDFYLNGGSTAIIVRLYKDSATATDASALFAVDGLSLQAASPGTWGQNLRVSMDLKVSDEVRAQLNLKPADLLFNLYASDGITTESFLNLTLVDSARRIDRVLASQSNLIQWKSTYPSSLPAMPLATAVQSASFDLAAKTAALAAANAANPQVTADIATAQANLANAQTAYDTAVAKLADPASTAKAVLATAQQANPQVPSAIQAARAAVDTAVAAFKGDDGQALDDKTYEGDQALKTGIYALEKADLFNILCIPADTRGGDTSSPVYQKALAYCQLRRAMLLVDSPAAWSLNKNTAAAAAKNGLPSLGLSGEPARNAAIYFPRVIASDPIRGGQLDTFVPCGIIAGLYASTDTSRGVWKAPAGLDAALNGIQALEVNLNDGENGQLNPLGINCLRFFPRRGRVIWGARTLRGSDQLGDDYMYVPVRRTALYIEESLYRGMQWAVFEPNDEPLWAQIRLNAGAFMYDLFRKGAFQGQTPKEAYFVKCGSETTPQDQIHLGIVNIIVGFAPLKPAEFVVIQVQQMTGRCEPE